MNTQPKPVPVDTDHEHCQILALALINRAVMDLNSPDSVIRQDAESFLESDSPMLHYYMSMIADKANVGYLIDVLREHSQPGSQEIEAIQQRIRFGNRLSQLMNMGATANDPGAKDPQHSNDYDF